MKSLKKIPSIAGLLVLILSACTDDYLNTYPSSSISIETIFQNTETAEMAVNGMARLMVNQYSGYGQMFCGEGSIKFIYGEYMGENFSIPNLSSSYYSIMNGVFFGSNTSSYTSYPWAYYYMLIGNANMLLANIDQSSGEEKKRKFLKAQALCYRAYAYTQLVQLYCPRWMDSQGGSSMTNLQQGLILRTEANKDEKDIALVPSGEIFKQIYTDLDQAISLFNESGMSRKKIWEPNRDVAYAIYARAAIVRQDYSRAAEMAVKARKDYPLMSNNDYISGFSKENREWIWGSYGGDEQSLYYSGFHSYMAYDANTSAVRSNPACISKTLYERIPRSDIRKELFLDPGDDKYSQINGVVSVSLAKNVRARYPTMKPSHQIAAYMGFKFSINGSIGVGYINHFRSAEMYLIEAEANYFMNKDNVAQRLLNELIRDSQRDPTYNCTSRGENLFKEIKFYRAVELWGEGFDWFDKKRYNEPIIRRSFKEGGNFGSSTAIKIEVNQLFGWTLITPIIESEHNDKL